MVVSSDKKFEEQQQMEDKGRKDGRAKGLNDDDSGTTEELHQDPSDALIVHLGDRIWNKDNTIRIKLLDEAHLYVMKSIKPNNTQQFNILLVMIGIIHGVHRPDRDDHGHIF